MVKQKLAGILFMCYTIIALVIGVLFHDHRIMVYGVFTGWFILWMITFILCTPYRSSFKVKEMMSALWMILITTYLFFIKEYILLAVFYLPASICFSLWREKQENEELDRLLNLLKESKNEKMFAWFKYQLKNKEHVSQYQDWKNAVAEIESSILKQNADR